VRGRVCGGRGRGSCEGVGLMSDMFDFCPYSVRKKGLGESVRFFFASCLQLTCEMLLFCE
jgi:hypothetical protein